MSAHKAKTNRRTHNKDPQKMEFVAKIVHSCFRPLLVNIISNYLHFNDYIECKHTSNYTSGDSRLGMDPDERGKGMPYPYYSKFY